MEEFKRKRGFACPGLTPIGKTKINSNLEARFGNTTRLTIVTTACYVNTGKVRGVGKDWRGYRRVLEMRSLNDGTKNPRTFSKLSYLERCDYISSWNKLRSGLCGKKFEKMFPSLVPKPSPKKKGSPTPSKKKTPGPKPPRRTHLNPGSRDNGFTYASNTQFEPDEGPGLDFSAPSFNWSFKSKPKKGEEGDAGDTGTDPPPIDPCDDPDGNCYEDDFDLFPDPPDEDPDEDEDEGDWVWDDEWEAWVNTVTGEVIYDYDYDEEEKDGRNERTVSPAWEMDFPSYRLSKEELKEAWAKVRNKSGEIKRTAGPGNASGQEIDPDDLWARTWGPLVRPTNPVWDDPEADLPAEEVLRLTFGAAPIDPMNPDYQRFPSGGGGMPASPTDTGTAGTPSKHKSAFASGQSRTSALYQMEDDWNR